MKIFVLFCNLLFVGMVMSPSLSMAAIEVNSDGKILIAEAAGDYSAEMTHRPIVTDKAYLNYLRKVMKKLQGSNSPPAGVVPRITVLDSPAPIIYSYTDGNIVISTTAILAADNEAQLAAELSHEMAHVLEGHYILLYQKLKAAERKQRFMSTTGAIFGALLDSAVEYSVDIESAEQADRVMKGEQSYLSAMKSTAKINAAQSSYYGVKDAIANIPEEDSTGKRIDPRQRFEIAADAQGMVLLARAGYDAHQAPLVWENLRAIKNNKAKSDEAALGDMAEQMRQMQSMMKMMESQMEQALDKSGLTRTISDIPPSRSALLENYTELKEVKAAGKGDKGTTPYRKFIANILIPRAELNLAEENYDKAASDYRNLYRKGFNSAPILYGLAKSSLGDFAFSASTQEKQEAEKLYLAATSKQKDYALAWKGLAELYNDWERYKDAAAAYKKYLTAAPNAKDSSKIKRKIKSLNRKADF